MRIFLSYSHKNAIYKNLVKRKASAIDNTTVDTDDAFLRGGMDFYHKIYDRIVNADIIISILTQDYLDSAFCMAEADEAINNEKKLYIISFGVVSSGMQAFINTYSSPAHHMNIVSTSSLTEKVLQDFLNDKNTPSAKSSETVR